MFLFVYGLSCKGTSSCLILKYGQWIQRDIFCQGLYRVSRKTCPFFSQSDWRTEYFLGHPVLILYFKAQIIYQNKLRQTKKKMFTLSIPCDLSYNTTKIYDVWVNLLYLWNNKTKQNYLLFSIGDRKVGVCWLFLNKANANLSFSYIYIFNCTKFTKQNWTWSHIYVPKVSIFLYLAEHCNLAVLIVLL